ncbi:15737_t:CDS:2 [Acaulospora colombiana]|uniref:15737_t:CDS:1 n=1 Tax=Acaulospora colombiana TaxID=27376 RepID=A0ACA9P7R1_9GLOM|nr:15737_t:CDS:2 [Acaulospora colombiana]
MPSLISPANVLRGPSSGGPPGAGAGAAATLSLFSVGPLTTNTLGITLALSGDLASPALPFAWAGGVPASVVVAGEELADNKDFNSCDPGEGAGRGLYTDELKLVMLDLRGVLGVAVTAGEAGAAGRTLKHDLEIKFHLPGSLKMATLREAGPLLIRRCLQPTSQTGIRIRTVSTEKHAASTEAIKECLCVLILDHCHQSQYEKAGE